MKKRLKITLVFLLVISVFSLFTTSCGTDSESIDGPTPPKTDSPSQNGDDTDAPPESIGLEDYDDVYVITGYFEGNNGAQGNDQMQHEWLLENLKIDIQGSWPSGENVANKLSTMVASEDMPDVIKCGTGYRPILQEFVEAGMVLSFDEYLSIMPDYMGYVNDEILDFWRDKNDGKLYMLPGFTKPKERFTELLGDPMVLGIRSDVVESTGRAIPKTMDELYEFLKASKESVGNEGHYKDFIPFGMMHFANNNELLFAHGFGLPGGNVLVDDANQMIVEPFMQEAWKEAYKFLARLYREELLDPEIVTGNNETILEKGKQGRYGILFTDISSFGDNIEGAIERLGIPGKYQTMELPKLDGIDKTNWLYYNQLGGSLAIVNKNVKDPERLMKYINWQNTVIGNMITWWGAPHPEESWFYIDENGEPMRNAEFCDALLRGEKNTDKVSPWSYWIAGPGVTTTADINAALKNSPGIRPFHMESKEIGYAQAYNDPRLDRYFLTEKGPIYKQKWTDIDAIVSKYRAELIMRSGSDSAFEENYNKMIAELDRAGIYDVQKENYELFIEVNK
jgi:putative aldouronate transport system substrate-binding protein